MSQAMMNQTTCSQTANHATSHHPAAAVASLPGRLFSSAVRGGFTVIEILVVIVIIGILVGLLVPGMMSATRRAREFAIEQEIAQLTSSLETFKAKYGFYPPDFTGITTIDQFLPYLNRIAPNHQETSTTIANWWGAVGSKLAVYGPQASYVFWLSGLSKNKQYPLTNNITLQPLEAFNVGTIEREVFFEFKQDRLYDPATVELIGKSPNTIATYSQFTGACQPIVYFEVKRLSAISFTLPVDLSSFVTVTTADGNCKLFPYFVEKGTQVEFLNKDKFQLFAPGTDARFGAGPPDYANAPNLSNSLTPRDRDNLTNFSEGRLELLQLN
jgi:prepilin-type N-terminal cleavage/methylation domain-containing protein